MKVIAEPANYWQGDYKLLYQCIGVAAACDFDVFKVQLYDTNSMGAGWEARKKHYKESQFDISGLNEVAGIAAECGLEFLVTVFQTHLLDMALEATNSIKIASGQLSENAMKRIIERQHSIRSLYISTGMSHGKYEIEELHEFLLTTEIPEIHVMHCTSLYPPDDSEINMSRIDVLKEVFDDMARVQIGFSDHGRDNIAALMAAAKNISCLEMHFKIKGMFGKTSQYAYDHESAENVIAVFRRMENMHGNGQLLMQPREEAVFNKYETRWVDQPTITPEPRTPNKNIIHNLY